MQHILDFVDRAFGRNASKPDPVETVVARVRDALLAPGSESARLLVLDDAAAAADPLQLRLVIQSIAGLVGRTAVALRPGAGAMALANVLVALKSGIRHLAVSAETGGRYAAASEVRTMLARMGVEVRT